ncbi:Protein angel 1 [Mactra antiquata]
MCGDFNSLPHCDIYKFMVMGFLKYEGLDVHAMSGQKEDVWDRRYGPELQHDFLPSGLSIGHNCKYISTEHCGTSSKNDGKESSDNVKELASHGRGYLNHLLRCISVYKHRASRSDYRSREVTTYHGKGACTVDYIFYNVTSGLVSFYDGEVHTSDIVEGHLNLLARYSLLCDRDLDKMKSLPNKQYGSDHFSLIAKFLLT